MKKIFLVRWSGTGTVRAGVKRLKYYLQEVVS